MTDMHARKAERNLSIELVSHKVPCIGIFAYQSLSTLYLFSFILPFSCSKRLSDSQLSMIKFRIFNLEFKLFLVHMAYLSSLSLPVSSPL